MWIPDKDKLSIRTKQLTERETDNQIKKINRQKNRENVYSITHSQFFNYKKTFRVKSVPISKNYFVYYQIPLSDFILLDQEEEKTFSDYPAEQWQVFNNNQN